MQLKEWANEYLNRNCKIKQWDIIEKDDSSVIIKTQRGTVHYEFYEELTSEIKFDDNDRVIITLNTKKNIKIAQELFDSLNSKTRILFANTETDSFWILNPHFIRNYSSPEQFKKNPGSFVGETPYM